MSDTVQQATARLAAAQKHGHDPGRIAEARNALVAARLERDIRRALRPEPPYAPIKQADRTRLAKILLEE